MSLELSLEVKALKRSVVEGGESAFSKSDLDNRIKDLDKQLKNVSIEKNHLQKVSVLLALESQWL